MHFLPFVLRKLAPLTCCATLISLGSPSIAYLSKVLNYPKFIKNLEH